MTIVNLTHGTDIYTNSTSNLFTEINALNGSDTVRGNNNTDYIFGGGGNDELYGNGGDDILAGETGHDELYGGSGNDLLVGGSGNDILDGGTGTNLLYGGEGDDTYYASVYDGINRIHDAKTITGVISSGGGNDTIIIEDISFAEISLHRGNFDGDATGNDLLITSQEEAADGIVNFAIIVEDFFVQGDHMIETFQDSNGFQVAGQQIIDAFLALS